MASESDSKNGVKTIFLIFNSFMFLLTLLCFVLEVGSGAFKGFTVQNIFDTVFWIVLIFVTIGGYCAAVGEKEKSLKTYAYFMTMLAAREIIYLIRITPAAEKASPKNDDLSNDEASFLMHIFITIVMLVTILLGGVLYASVSDNPDNAANKSNNQANQS